MKRKLTAEDLERNPDLKDWGCKEGDEIEIPENQTLSNEEDDPGGIEVPKKPPPPAPTEP